jgi:signal transduction histidine kinase
MLLQAELIQSATTDPEILECVQDIIRTGRRGADLVARLGLSLREDIPVVPNPIDLKTVVDEAVETSRAIWEVASKLEGRKIELKVDIDDDLSPVMTTESGLIDIVIDLINNANEALPKGGKITISATQTGNKVRLTVHDDGVGMHTHSLEHATSPFFTTKNDVGSGLGLSTIENLVNAWGGYLDLASKPGHGTTVLVVLPTAE